MAAPHGAHLVPHWRRPSMAGRSVSGQLGDAHMPESLLNILKVAFLALLWLFFLRVLRAVWAELKAPSVSAPIPTPTAAPAPAAPPAPSSAAFPPAARPTQALTTAAGADAAAAKLLIVDAPEQ